MDLQLIIITTGLSLSLSNNLLRLLQAILCDKFLPSLICFAKSLSWGVSARGNFLRRSSLWRLNRFLIRCCVFEVCHKLLSHVSLPNIGLCAIIKRRKVLSKRCSSSNHHHSLGQMIYVTWTLSYPSYSPCGTIKVGFIKIPIRDNSGLILAFFHNNWTVDWVNLRFWGGHTVVLSRLLVVEWANRLHLSGLFFLGPLARLYWLALGERLLVRLSWDHITHVRVNLTKTLIVLSWWEVVLGILVSI